MRFDDFAGLFCIAVHFLRIDIIAIPVLLRILSLFDLAWCMA